MSGMMVTPPPDWTTDDEYLNAAAMWADNGDGSKLAKGHNLPAPYTPIMCTLPQSGDALYLFSAGGSKHYLWNRIEDSLFEVTSPNTQQEIIDNIDLDYFVHCIRTI